jgi:hypothetical protein
MSKSRVTDSSIAERSRAGAIQILEKPLAQVAKQTKLDSVLVQSNKKKIKEDISLDIEEECTVSDSLDRYDSAIKALLNEYKKPSEEVLDGESNQVTRIKAPAKPKNISTGSIVFLSSNVKQISERVFPPSSPLSIETEQQSTPEILTAFDLVYKELTIGKECVKETNVIDLSPINYELSQNLINNSSSINNTKPKSSKYKDQSKNEKLSNYENIPKLVQENAKMDNKQVANDLSQESTDSSFDENLDYDDIPVNKEKSDKINEFLSELATKPIRRVECRRCGRKFNEDRIQKHQNACKNTSKEPKSKKKNKFIKPVPASMKKNSIPKWKIQSEQFREAMRSQSTVTQSKSIGKNFNTLCYQPRTQVSTNIKSIPMLKKGTGRSAGRNNPVKSNNEQVKFSKSIKSTSTRHRALITK